MLAVWPIKADSRLDDGLALIRAVMTTDMRIYRLPSNI
jgi:hypothetical protein